MKVNYNNITTLADLQTQIRLLKADYTHREVMLKQDAKTYVAQFSPANLIKKLFSPNGFQKLDEKTNISGNILSVVLPFILNQTVFRGSGFITKAVAALVSGKVGKSIDGEKLTGIVNGIKSIFTKKGKKREVNFVDYGIPPDSETY